MYRNLLAARSVTCGSATPERPHGVQPRKLARLAEGNNAEGGVRTREGPVAGRVSVFRIYLSGQRLATELFVHELVFTLGLYADSSSRGTQ